MTMRTLPSRLVDAFAEVIRPLFSGRSAGARIVALDHADGPTLYRVARGRAALIGPVTGPGDDEVRRLRAHRASEVELRLPAELVLRRTVRLPAAGRDYFPAILEHRLDRLTPWQPSQVLFGFDAAGAADEEGQVTVAFVATSTAIAEQAEARLAAVGLVPTALGTAGSPLEAPLPIDLFRGRRDRARSGLRRGVIVAAAVLCALFIPLCAGSFWLLHRNGAALEAVEQRLLAARRAMVAAAGSGGERERADALLAAKTPVTAVARLIDGLAATIPSDTYLQRLEIGPAEVRLVGISGNAPALIGLLDASGITRDVAFAAPVVRNIEGRDVFDIAASRVSPAAAAGPE